MKILAWLWALWPLLFLVTACDGIPLNIELTSAPAHVPTATAGDLAGTTPPPTGSPALDLGRVAYLKAGDLWIKTLPGGTPRRLTTAGQFNSPRWSPSGQWLAVRKAEQLWLVQADGHAAYPLDEGTTVGAFAWAPTSDRLAYVTGYGELRLTGIDQTEPVTLVAPNEPGLVQAGRVAWSSDESWLAYDWQDRPTVDSPPRQGIWQISVDGQNPIELYNSGIPDNGVAVLAGWSPTGNQVLFWQGEILSASLLADGVPLYRIAAGQTLAGNSRPAPLSTGPMLLYADFLAPAPPESAWAAEDGVALVVGAGREAWTNKRLELAGRPLTPKTVVAVSPAWSPDGQRIAYVAMPDPGNLWDDGAPAIVQVLMQRRIWLTTLSGNGLPRQLTKDGDYRDERPMWSADGSHLLFARLDSQRRASLWLIPAEGGEPQQIAGDLAPAAEWFDYYGHLDWSQLLDWWRG